MSRSRETSQLPPEFLPGFLKQLQEFKPLPVSELNKRLAEIKQAMEAHDGEFFLVVEREWQEGFGVKFKSSSLVDPQLNKPEHWFIKTEARLGICTSPYIESRPTFITIHPKSHALYSEKRLSLDPILIDHCVSDFLHDLERLLPNKSSLWVKGGDPGVALRVIVGDEQVCQWFLDESLTVAAFDLVGKLKAEDPERYRQEISRRGKPETFVAFYKMQKLLGRVLEPQLPEVNKAVQGLKLKIVNKLLALTEKDVKLQSEIEKIFQVPARGGFLHEGPGLTLIEDEDDAFVASFGKQLTLQETRREVNSVLKEAFELDMHKNEEVLRREVRPGQVVEVNTARLVRGFCEYYEIPIPQ